MSVLFRPFPPFTCPLPQPLSPFSPLVCCFATSSFLKSLINIAAALDVMQCRFMQIDMSAACASLLLQATAVPFLALTRPKGACIGCPEQHCSAAFAKCAQLHLAASPCVFNTDLVVQCLHAREAGNTKCGTLCRGHATNAQRSRLQTLQHWWHALNPLCRESHIWCCLPL